MAMITEIKKMVELIDKKFEEYCGKIRRVDLDWGTWSVVLNKEIRKRIEAKDPETKALGLVYGYWIAISQLLDMIYYYQKNGRLYKIFNERKILRKTEEANELRRIILE
jgi:hypothetical protein